MRFFSWLHRARRVLSSCNTRQARPRLEHLEVRALLSVLINVDAAANPHPINPNIYGVNAGDATTLSDLNVPFNRLGGNLTTRYNWQLDAFNHASDFYFESIGEGGGTSGNVNSFITTTRAGGAQPTVTIPTLGWVARLGPNGEKRASFSVGKYGAQDQTDADFFPDAGNGIRPGGNPSSGPFVVGNDPNDANVPSNVAFQQGFVQGLIDRLGTANNGGVRYYTLDNEPGLWHETHRDVHPTGATMQEVVDKLISYGSMVKDADPAALTLGPEEWGYLGYFYSGFDKQYLDQNGFANPPPDRTAHGNQDFIPFVLQQLANNNTATGRRLLDILTVHFYPQSSQGSTDVSPATQLLRNRSTRSLWDPNYVDESYIADLAENKVQLVPRLKNWVATYYPGTKIGVTEYDWGAENHMNGATTQADILGIFGREGLDLATRFAEASSGGPAIGSGAPTLGSAVSNAFKMYRNYDGQKSTFGDQSVAAAVPDPDQLSSFAAVRSADGVLTVMVVNKSLYDPNNPTAQTAIDVNLTHYAGAGTAEVWQLFAPNPNDMTQTTIQRRQDVSFVGANVNLDLPRQSVTLLVIRPAGTQPGVTALTPAEGATTGGTVVTITGTNLAGATAVAFGGTAATNFIVQSATQIQATAPAHATGTVDITVTTPGGTSPTSPASRFTYAAPSAGPGRLGFSALAYSAREGTTANVTITRSGGSDGAVSVTVNSSGGSATQGADYTGLPLTVTLAAGETSKTITLPISDDVLIEGNESAQLTLSNPTGGATLDNLASTTLTLLDNDGPQPGVFQFSAATYTAAEGGGTATVTVTRTDGSDGSALVTVTASGGTASAGSDFTGLPLTIAFAPGETSKSLLVTLLEDTAAEGTETILLTLSGATGGAGLGNQITATLNLTDNDFSQPGALGFAAATAAIAENAGQLALTIQRTGGTDGTVSIGYVVTVPEQLRVKERATSGEDFQGTLSGSVTFAAGETTRTLLIPIVDDNLVEATTESFVVTLSNPTNGAQLGSLTTVTVGIRDDDLPAVADATLDLRRLQLAADGFGKSEEHYRDFVQKAYARFLSRQPDEQGFTYWVSLMQLYEKSQHAMGLRQEDIEAGFLASLEYEGKNGGLGRSWIAAIYRDLLGRPGEQAGIDFWLARLTEGVAPAAIAKGFTGSEERLRNRVAETYRTLLDREPDPAGLEYWVATFKQGGTTEDIVSGFVGSQEYYADKRGFNNPAKWVREAYLDVLFRPASVGEFDYWLRFLQG